MKSKMFLLKVDGRTLWERLEEAGIDILSEGEAAEAAAAFERYTRNALPEESFSLALLIAPWSPETLEDSSSDEKK